jgi:hypothetical protein
VALGAIASNQVPIIILGAVVIWLVLAALVAEYGRGKGFPWFPLFICGVFLSWALVLLAVTIGGGPRLKS